MSGLVAMPEYRCIGCGLDTNEAGEYYMLLNDVWAKTGRGDAMACVGCVERRLGRRLTAGDFAECPLNAADWNAQSRRLRQRLGVGEA
jgi:hypothetical protein